MLNDLLMSKLNEAFVSSVSINANAVKRFLELYLSLGRLTYAENVCRTEVVTPAMKSILNENYLQSSKDGLKELYSQCYTFLQVDLKHLLQAAEEQNNVYASYLKLLFLSIVIMHIKYILFIYRSNKFCKFNFVSKSFWPVIFDQVKNNLQCIYNFREPDVFIKV